RRLPMKANDTLSLDVRNDTHRIRAQIDVGRPTESICCCCKCNHLNMVASGIPRRHSSIILSSGCCRFGAYKCTASLKLAQSLSHLLGGGRALDKTTDVHPFVTSSSTPANVLRLTNFLLA